MMKPKHGLKETCPQRSFLQAAVKFALGRRPVNTHPSVPKLCHHSDMSNILSVRSAWRTACKFRIAVQRGAGKKWCVGERQDMQSPRIVQLCGEWGWVDGSSGAGGRGFGCRGQLDLQRGRATFLGLVWPECFWKTDLHMFHNIC